MICVGSIYVKVRTLKGIKDEVRHIFLFIFVFSCRWSDAPMLHPTFRLESRLVDEICPYFMEPS